MNTNEEKLKLFFAYFPPLVGGFVVYLMESNDKFVRFHAMQGIIMGVLYTLIRICCWVLAWVPLLGFILSEVISWVAGIVLVVLTVICIVKAMRGEEYRLPVIGDKAMEIINR